MDGAKGPDWVREAVVAVHAVFAFSLGVPHFLFRLRGGSPIALWF